MYFHGWFDTFRHLSSEWNPIIISFKNVPNCYCSAFTQWLASLSRQQASTLYFALLLKMGGLPHRHAIFKSNIELLTSEVIIYACLV